MESRARSAELIVALTNRPARAHAPAGLRRGVQPCDHCSGAFATFWLAIALVAGLALLLGHALNQDAWILSRHPAVSGLAQTWTQVYEQQGAVAAQRLLERRRHRAHIDVQVLGENGEPVIRGTFPPRAAAFEARQRDRDHSLPWRRLTEDYTSPASGDTYLFIYRIPHPELRAWHRGSLFWPLSALAIALVVLSGFSLLLTLSIARPLDRLRSAVHDLGQTTYQQNSLARLARRRDELGVLAGDFNRMGAHLQTLIGSQRQLLRDVSHELRSPLARLRIALALAERATPAEREALWPRLTKESRSPGSTDRRGAGTGPDGCRARRGAEHRRLPTLLRAELQD
ncbi:hypothetical protein SSTU70S_05092 [Stutzerimonas stutzeri]